MPQSIKEEVHQPLEPPLLDYGCSEWKTSSQCAADLFHSGVKLWRKEDLVDIEQQLGQSRTTERFTVRRFDGSFVHIKNPMFGVQQPIWTPYIKYQEFWRLVKSKPDGPPETYLCTYLVDWVNRTVRNYEGPIENVRLLFEASQKRWETSAICEAFVSRFRRLFSSEGNAKRVTKIICFGLGELNLKPKDWWRIENSSKPEHEREPETIVVEAAFTHHAIALTMLDLARSCAGDIGVRLLTQDPNYTDESKDMLREIGFEVVGGFGAGGFAEMDSESIIFSPFTSAPVKQIIADLARPVAIICLGGTSAGVFNHLTKPYADPESPRTRQMWKGYESWDFPVPSESVQLEGSLHQLVIRARTGE